MVERQLATTKVSRYQLFDLAADPGEQNDLTAAKPQLADQLVDRLTRLIESGRSRPAK